LKKLFLFLGCDWLLNEKLGDRRESDHTLSWADACEGPSMFRSVVTTVDSLGRSLLIDGKNQYFQN